MTSETLPVIAMSPESRARAIASRRTGSEYMSNPSAFTFSRAKGSTKAMAVTGVALSRVQTRKSG